ncbi:GntP family permease [Parvularcula oceani]|uniref:GntP family permease n=1 Tax=Parvularcula oceani TaxID=1247963 RepID=UPI0004E0F099|nr:gluconate:H+ symporter [Parvularcula oceani]
MPGETLGPILATGAAVAALLLLVLRARLPAFLALILVSLLFGISVGMAPEAVLGAVREGVGGTLGFVAVVVGLGAMMGALLEASGGIDAISGRILSRFGPKRAPAALTLIGLLVSIPVFFDVALIILLPVLVGLRQKTGRPLIAFAIPLLAGLAVAHAFVPPTPGPIAVADILGAELGLVMLFGLIAGLPAALVGGPLLAAILARSSAFEGEASPVPAASGSGGRAPDPAGFLDALLVILVPVFLILLATALTGFAPDAQDGILGQVILFIGHPFSALTIACLFGWWRLGRARGMPAADLQAAMARALEPAGLVVLVTGAGGAFKQVLVDSGAGAALAASLQAASVPLLLFGFVTAGIVRLAQGSATVAMVTAAGLAAPVVQTAGVPAPQVALLVIAIASGASLTSHVNDSGFWLVSRYLGLTEAQTLRSWTVCTTLIGLVGFLVASLLGLLIG